MAGFWQIITNFGAPEVWAIAALGFVVIYLLLRKKLQKRVKKKFKEFLKIYLPSLAITFAIIFAIKSIFPSQRPCTPCFFQGQAGCNTLCPMDSSFPSGHSATIFIVFTSLFLVLRKRRFLWIFIIPFAVSISRIFLQVHTYSDVTAGAVIGILIPMGVEKLINKNHN